MAEDGDESDFDPTRLKRKADLGDADAQVEYAQFLMLVGATDRSALHYIHRAMDKKHPQSYLLLAQVHREGLFGFRKDPAEAEKLLREAVALGSRPAALLLAECHLEAKRYSEARALLEPIVTDASVPAAEMAEASLLLATVLHESGDAAGAAAVTIRAADAGHPEACHNAGLMFHEGLGVPRNPQRAVRYLAAAVSRGRTDSLPHLALALAGADVDPDSGDRLLTDRTRRAQALLRSVAARGVLATESAQAQLDAMLAASPPVREEPPLAHTAPEASSTCANLACQRTGATALCGQCRRARYCSRECQVEDWKLFGHAGPCKASQQPSSS